jgi:hypothetical protein
VINKTCTDQDLQVSGGQWPTDRIGKFARHATSSGTTHQSLFAWFSSEKDDSCSFSEEKDPKRLLFPPHVEASGLPHSYTGRGKILHLP